MRTSDIKLVTSLYKASTLYLPKTFAQCVSVKLMLKVVWFYHPTFTVALLFLVLYVKCVKNTSVSYLQCVRPVVEDGQEGRQKDKSQFEHVKNEKYRCVKKINPQREQEQCISLMLK